MKVSKIFAPVVFGALATAGASVHAAAGTDAGTLIENTAKLDFKVNGVSQTPVEASKDFKVDIRLDYLVERAAKAVADTSSDPITLGGQTGEFYLAAAYDLTNETNGGLTLTFNAADTSGQTVSYNSNDYTDNIDLSNSGNYIIFLAADTSGTTPTGNAIAELDFSKDQTQRVLVYANKDNIIGKDTDVLVSSLTATGKFVTVAGEANPVAVPADDSAANTDAAVEFVFADGADASLGGNTETAYDALALVFPDIPVDPTNPDDPTKNGLIKKSAVVWDPINGTSDAKAIPGAVIRYTLEVRNLGRAEAQDIVVFDNIPTNTSYCTTAQTGANGDFSCVAAAATGSAADLGSTPAVIQATTDQTFSGETYTADANGTVFVHYPTFAGKPASGEAKVSTITFDVTVD